MSLELFGPVREKKLLDVLRDKARQFAEWFARSRPSTSSSSSDSEPSSQNWEEYAEGQTWGPITPILWGQGQWERGQEIASGGFGKVFEAHHKMTGQLAVLKVEEEHERSNSRSGVMREVEVYKSLAREMPNMEGFPEMYDQGSEERHRFLILERLGLDLYRIARAHSFSMRHVLIFALQAVNRIEVLHRAGYVHCDIKPTNFVAGKRDPSRIYLIDFGLSKRYIDSKGKHIEKVKGKFQGTVSFASPNVIGGWDPSRRDEIGGWVHSRRDDLISLVYSVIYLKEGTLPWMFDKIATADIENEGVNVEAEAEGKEEIVVGPAKVDGSCSSFPSPVDNEKMKNLNRRWIAEKQAKVGLGELCENVAGMEEILRYLLKLQFEEELNYDFLRVVLKKHIDESDL